RSLFDDFTQASLGSSWFSSTWSSGSGTAAVTSSGGILSVGRTQVLSAQTFAGVAVEGRVAFGAAAWQQFGIATNLGSATGNYWAVFSTRGTTNTLYARVNVSGTGQAVKIGALPTGFHVYKVQPVSGAF